MRPRSELIDCFSTFIQFETDAFNRWVADIRLCRSMQHHLRHTSVTSESFWAGYWHTQWQTQGGKIAHLHLAAYVQEPCYWASRKIGRQLTDSSYPLSDCFQQAIAELDTVLSGYDPTRGSNLKTYAGMVFTSLLRDRLRQRHEAALCTDWALLRRVSKKRFIEALQSAGLSSEAIAQYRLSWFCFNATYIATAPSVKASPPDDSLWERVATLYNREAANQLPLTSRIDGATARQWLTQCATRVRSYLYPAIASLNIPRPGQDSGELQDNLADPQTESLLADLITLEEEQQRAVQHRQMQHILITTLEQLAPESQHILQLYYHHGLTQQQIMQQLQLSQATVSRRLTKSREALLTAVLGWSQKTLDKPATSTLIKSMSTALEEWLEVHFGTSRDV